MKQALPPDVQQLVDQGRTLDAIKRLRELSGLGLKEAKEAVDAGSWQAPQARPIPANLSLGTEVQQALARGALIDAIKALRNQHPGLSLKEAKDLVEAHLDQHPALKAQAQDAFAAQREAWLSRLRGWALNALLLGLLAWLLWRWLRPD